MLTHDTIIIIFHKSIKARIFLDQHLSTRSDFILIGSVIVHAIWQVHDVCLQNTIWFRYIKVSISL